MKISKDQLKELINLIPGKTLDLHTYYGQYLVLESNDPINGVRVTITVTNKRTL